MWGIVHESGPDRSRLCSHSCARTLVHGRAWKDFAGWRRCDASTSGACSRSRTTGPVFVTDCPVLPLPPSRVIVEVRQPPLPGVVDAYLNPATDTAYVEYDPARCGPAELTRILEDAGVKTGTPAAA